MRWCSIGKLGQYPNVPLYTTVILAWRGAIASHVQPFRKVREQLNEAIDGLLSWSSLDMESRSQQLSILIIIRDHLRAL